MSEKQKPGTIGWHDMTVDDADGVRDFYKAVVGWESQGLDMDGGSYQDYVMTAPDGTPAGGVCHHKGTNADIPKAVWLMYIIVEDLNASAEKCVELGGKILKDARSGAHKYCIIQDPAGAICALYQAASDEPEKSEADA